MTYFGVLQVYMQVSMYGILTLINLQMTVMDRVIVRNNLQFNYCYYPYPPSSPVLY